MIGQDITPGIVTNVESLPAASVGGISAANVILVGQGDLDDGDADANTPYTVAQPSAVSDYFGSGNMISGAINDALNEGALPVYAVVTDEEEQTEQLNDISGTLEHAPLTEDPEEISIDGYEVNIVYTDPSDNSPGDNDIYINPVTGDYEAGTTPSEEDITYTSFDYDGALQSVEDEAAEDIDYVYVLNENPDVADKLQDVVNSMENYHQFAIGGIGVSPELSDVTSYENSFDNSRMQVFYPSRNNENETIMGAIGGLKARLGINGSSMNKRLRTHTRLVDRIDFNDEDHLIGENTVPVASQTRGALLVDDPTTVTDDNQEESQMRDGYSRLVVDRVTQIVYETERPYIGKLNKPSVRGSLQSNIRTGIQFLEEQDAILEYNVRVFENDAMSASVDVSVETTKPLRNIYNTISVGE